MVQTLIVADALLLYDFTQLVHFSRFTNSKRSYLHL